MEHKKTLAVDTINGPFEVKVYFDQDASSYKAIITGTIIGPTKVKEQGDPVSELDTTDIEPIEVTDKSDELVVDQAKETIKKLAGNIKSVKEKPRH